MQVHDPAFVQYLHTHGWLDAEPLAVGMEGSVYRLGDGSIAKLWANQTHEQLNALAEFYSQLDNQLFGVKAPLITDVIQFDTRLASIERELPGVPLSEFVVEGAPAAPAKAVSATLDILDALRAIDIPAARELKVFGEPSPWESADAWPDVALNLIDRRLAQFGDQLERVVPEFDARVSAVREQVVQSTSPVSLIHGDIGPVNILVDADIKPLAILDFGFVTTAAPPQIDAAIAAGIFDMYSPNAALVEAQLDTAIIDRFGYDAEELALYKAVYGLIDSNAYDPTGQDGNFKWCAKMIERVEL